MGTLLTISDYRGDIDNNSGFYPSTDDTPAIMLVLPAALSTFLETRLREPIANGVQSMRVDGNDQIDPQSTAAGYAILGPTPKHTPYTHLIQEMSLTVQPVAEGLGVVLNASVIAATTKSRTRSASTKIEAAFLINRETRTFRFHHRIEKQTSRPGLRRAYAGDEVQTSRETMIVTHPVVFNTGGTFALSPQGTHSAEITQAGTFIQPVALTGWGWGSVYSADTQIGRRELALPWLTRDLVRTALYQLGRRSKDKIIAHINRRDGDFGYYTQAITDDDNHRRAFNQRTVKTINTEFALDRFGLALTIDAHLSEIVQATHDGTPEQGTAYQKTLLLPWEVLILRDFEITL